MDGQENGDKDDEGDGEGKTGTGTGTGTGTAEKGGQFHLPLRVLPTLIYLGLSIIAPKISDIIETVVAYLVSVKIYIR